MSNTVTNVSTGKPKVSGSIHRAVRSENLTIPTTASETLTEDFKCLGYISEDGVTNDLSMETDKVKAWGGDTVLVFQTDKGDIFKFKLLETLNEDVLKAVFGSDNVTVTGDGTV